MCTAGCGVTCYLFVKIYKISIQLVFSRVRNIKNCGWRLTNSFKIDFYFQNSYALLNCIIIVTVN